MLPKIAIFGSTGYIGMILSEKLAYEKAEAKLFARNKRRLGYLKKFRNIKIRDIELSQNNIEKIAKELNGYDIVVYLIHSMSKEIDSFDAQDRKLATIVGEASAKAGIKSIVYLSGLGVQDEHNPISVHLQSRQDTAKALASFGVSVTELRAGVIIGAGSASFEIIRNLGTKLPFMPKLSIETGFCQPIDVDSVIDYIIEASINEKYKGKIIEIGSEDVLKYSQMVKIFADDVKHRNMPYFSLPIIEKFLSKTLISWVISRATSLPMGLTKPLIGGIESLAIVKDYPVSKIDPDSKIKPLAYSESIKVACDRETNGDTISLWGLPIESQAYDKKESSYFRYGGYEINGLLYEEKSIEIEEYEIEDVFCEIKKIGGKHGYWSSKWLWEIRGILDKIVGGPGLLAGKRSHKNMREGERVDFWEISRLIERKYFKKLRLKSIMKTPGKAWLEFTITKKDKKSYLILRAYFEPSGILGYIYWYSLYFIHKYIFAQMISKIYQNVKIKNIDYHTQPSLILATSRSY